MATADALKRGRRATMLVFLLVGAVWGSWAPHVALVKQRLDLSPGILGLVLLSAAAGAMVFMPLVGGVIARIGSGPLTRLLAPIVALTLLLPALAPNLPLLFAGALLLGSASGAIDIAMNAHGVAIETSIKRPIISRLHALYSLGVLVGAGVAALLLPLVGNTLHIVIVTVLLLALTIPVMGGLLPASLDAGGATPKLTWPPRLALAIGLLAFVAMVGEGAVQDWSAVYLYVNLGSGEGVAALGVAAFAATMTLGRLYGDRLRARFADSRLLVASSIVAAGGLAIGILIPHPATAIAGFGIMGLGMANIVPLAFAAGARIKGLPSGVGLAAVATIGYAGHMIGPVAIGGIAELAGLRWSLFLLVLGLLAIAFAVPHILQARHGSGD